MQNLVLSAACSEQDANRPAREGGFRGLYLTRQHYDHRITESTVGRLGTERKFVFLRNVLRPEGVAMATCRLKYFQLNDAKASRRIPNFFHASHGEDIVLGWLFHPYWRITQATKVHPVTYRKLFIPLALSMQGLMTEYWPEAARLQADRARTNNRMLVGAELSIFSDVSNITASPIFSSVTINRNLLCPSHADGRNAPGLSCLAAFGDWVGADLCFPRLRVAFKLAPGDVLIADTVNEQHGNVGPMAGTRISTVFYLRAATARSHEQRPAVVQR